MNNCCWIDCIYSSPPTIASDVLDNQNPKRNRPFRRVRTNDMLQEVEKRFLRFFLPVHNSPICSTCRCLFNIIYYIPNIRWIKSSEFHRPRTNGRFKSRESFGEWFPVKRLAERGLEPRSHSGSWWAQHASTACVGFKTILSLFYLVRGLFFSWSRELLRFICLFVGQLE